MRVVRQHRLNTMPCDLGKVRVIDASGPKVRHVGVAALVGANA